MYELFYSLSGVLLAIIAISVYIIRKLDSGADAFIRRRGENLATIADLEKITKIQENVKTDLLEKFTAIFRDESIRNSLATHTAIESFKTIIWIWKETYNLFFSLQKLFFNSEEKMPELMGKFHAEIQLNRENIFTNSYFLGGELTLKLVQLNGTIGNILRKDFHNRTLMKHSSAKLMDTDKDYERVNNLINDIEAWIIANLKTDRNISHFEFTKDQLEEIEKLKNQKFTKLEANFEE